MNTGFALQENARNARYFAMSNWCQENNYQHLLLAHHANDQFETFLMRLISGSGIKGLSAMKPVSNRLGINLLRPLLGVEKHSLIATLKRYNQDWIEDPTNQNLKYTRSRLRQQVAPLLEQEGLSAKRLYDITQKLALADDYITQNVNDWLENEVINNNNNSIAFGLSEFEKLHKELALRVLENTLNQLKPTDKPIRYEKLNRLFESINPAQSDKPTDKLYLAGCTIIIDIASNKIIIKLDE